MNVVRAQAMGLCFGVRDALDVAFEQPRPHRVTVHGELVHNEIVLDRLRGSGFRLTPESQRGQLPETAGVLVTAHGISDRERDRLERGGKTLIDTTCPLVSHAHDTAKQLQAEGYHVVVIGKPGHVEVRGLTGDLTTYDVVPSVEHVGRYAYPRIGVMCQTTMNEAHARAVLAEIETMNPDAEVRFVDTICEPTKQRIRAMDELVACTDIVIVVGGKNSNNTAQLASMCRDRGVVAHHVQGPGDLDPGWFGPNDTVGLTAGTSTLDETVDRVEAALQGLIVDRAAG